MDRPVLYLDVEGTLLLVGLQQVYYRPHLQTLLTWVKRHAGELDCRWLTSFSRHRVEAILTGCGASVSMISYQRWAGCKAAAIETDKPGFWIDDNCTLRDQGVLEDLYEGNGKFVFRQVRRWAGRKTDGELLEVLKEVRTWLAQVQGSPDAPGCREQE